MFYTKKLERDIQSQQIVVATVLGTLLHWYSFFVFGELLRPIINIEIPSMAGQSDILMTAAFIIGFFIRPLGSIYFGPKIDILGRKSLFNKSLAIISFSLILAFIFPFSFFPSVIGFSILIICRLMQGLAISIEYGSALSYIYESVPEKKSGFYIGLLQVTPPLGFVGAKLIVLFSSLMFTDGFFESFQWRFPLILGLIIFFITLGTRNKLPESAQFDNIKRQLLRSKNPLVDFINETNITDLFYAFFGISIVQGVLYYFIFSYLKTFFLKTSNFTPENIEFFLITIVSFLWPIILIFGKLSEIFDRKKLFLFCLLLNLVIIIFCLNYIENSPSSIIWSYTIPTSLMFMASLAVYSLSATVLVSLFPVKFRATGISIPYHVGNGVFGGVVILISFLERNGGELFFSEKNYIIFIILLAIVFNIIKILSEKRLTAYQQ